jgi:hypothetical protein
MFFSATKLLYALNIKPQKSGIPNGIPFYDL